MTLPVTAPVVQCTLSKPLLADGTVGTIKSASLKIDRDLVWVPSGETIYKENVPTPIITGTGPDSGTLDFHVIPVDVPGVHDAAGNEINFWSYTLRVVVLFPGPLERTVDYVFQPLLVDGNVDLDLVPQLDVVPIPPVATTGVLDGGTL
jgi:hypothetical protein